MPRTKPFTNPFYAVLVVTGVAFLLTAWGYFVVAARSMSVEPAAATDTFLVWMDEYGFAAMAIELVILAVATVSAIATDSYWLARTAAASADTDTPSSEPDG